MNGFTVLLVIGFIAYFLPTLIAVLRRHSAMAIFALNILLGWTALGWIAAFVWSLTPKKQLVVVVN